MVENLKIVKWRNNKFETEDDFIAEEAFLRIRINKNNKFDIIVTPVDIKEFVYGICFSECLIKNQSGIKNYSELKRKNIIEVEIELENLQTKQNYNSNFLWNYNILSTDCSNIPIPDGFEEGLEKINHSFKLSAIDLLTILSKTKEKSELFRITGAFHYSFLFTPKQDIEYYSFDISRHNAIDKVIGKALLSGINLENRILFTTGRITSSAVLKCLRAKIPFIISRSAPLLNAVRLARDYDLCVIGFLRSGRFNIYSSENNVLGS